MSNVNPRFKKRNRASNNYRSRARFKAKDRRNGASLDTIAVNVDQPRPDIYDLRRTAGRILPNCRTYHCGRTPRKTPDGEASQVSVQPGQVSGLQSCGSPHVCPVCSLKIAKGAPGKAGRRDDVAACLAWMNAQDGRLVFFTLTLSHGPHDPLTDLTAAQARAWRRMVQGKVWKELRGPYARTWEATHGENGWHPHYHLTMLMLPYSAREMEQLSKRWQMHQFQPDKPKCHAPDVVAAWLEAYSKHYDIQAAADRIKAEWIRCVKAEGMTASPAGQDVQLVADVEQLSRYHAKSWSLEDEHTNGLAKAGIGKSQWKLLEAAHNGDEKAAALFREFAAATERKRSITYSKGLKAAAKVQDNEDEDLAAAEVEGVVMAMLDAQLWKDAFAADQKVEREFRRMSKRYHDRFGDDIPSDWLEPLLDALGLDYERNGIFYRACRSKPPFESEPEPNQHRVLRQLLAK